MIKRTDANQAEIVYRLRKIQGLSVTSTHTIGKGFPDLIIGYKNQNYLVELKDGSKWSSQKKLTADELVFHQTWKGQVCVCECYDDILRLINLID